MKKILEELERKFRMKLNLETGKAFYMGKVEALIDEGYTLTQISAKLNKPESTIKKYSDLINRKRSKFNNESE